MTAHHVPGIPGPIALLGSGETTTTGRRVLAGLLRNCAEPRSLAVLDSPAGFQPNHLRVAGKLAEFITEKLVEWHPYPKVIETRPDMLGTPAGDAALHIIQQARGIVAGPGSPTYMVRQLADTPYLSAIRQAHQAGAALFFASAAAIAMAAYSLPVYEIFKVGADATWLPGLDLLGPLGMRLAIMPHWNNNEGGAELDTSHCFMGLQRFTALRAQLPADVTILGIDEHTACVLDFATQTVTVDGKGGVQIIQGDQVRDFKAGAAFPLALLGADPDAFAQAGEDAVPLTTVVAPQIAVAEPAPPAVPTIPPALIATLLELRTALRGAKQWAFADQVREALIAAGVVVEDTPQGPRWHMDEATVPGA